MSIQTINYGSAPIQWFQEEGTEILCGSEIKVINDEEYIEKNIFIDFYIKTYCQQWFNLQGDMWRPDYEEIDLIKKAKEQGRISTEREKSLLHKEKLSRVFHFAKIDFQNFSVDRGPLNYSETFKSNDLIWEAVQKILLENTSGSIFKPDCVTYVSKTFVENILGPAIPDSFLVTKLPRLMRQCVKKSILAVPLIVIASPILIIFEIFYRCVVNAYLIVKITGYRLSGNHANAALLSARASVNSRTPIRIAFSFLFHAFLG